ncbi:MAG: YbhB/YbcL family Raf kinase inhibitor-like protein [Methanocalculus sp.]|uniref:YbhB/YbcL family Raf kinase inhibitor-like protein n=1 Tax=Methanocalculus sp. TaxID=2004547 RepID=UPI0027277837|nr:YbhB/YbcL family Raf kinase inhibitor-like protein [Methanocalculus sp.]MDO8841310.1 YbhB/YbcL family Raf kinase inhibitor-like protein [Methanocalculus sp.]MDO9538927.1 YbhB/YbcL family Raf kinase inhibitor-like protein [Methanocalculus sp.]
MDTLKVTLGTRELPADYTCDGVDRSPPLHIGGLNEKVVALAVIMEDSSAAHGGSFTHWIIWNIEAVRILPEGLPKDPEIMFPVRAVQGLNDYGRIGYSGPCPASGSPHRYIFKVYALDAEISLPSGATKAELTAALSGHVIQFGNAEAIYSR